MSSMPPGPVVRVKPQSNIYTLLILLAAVFLAVAAGFAAHNLMTTYGLTFGDILSGKQVP